MQPESAEMCRNVKLGCWFVSCIYGIIALKRGDGDVS